VADRNIKVDPAATRKEIQAIADTVRSVAVPGPVPEASGATPIDLALKKVAEAQQRHADAWADAVAATVPVQQAEAEHAVQMLETQEAENADSIARIYPESGGAGAREV
jgi:hypothetical protein